MLNAGMSLQKLYARLPLLNTPYERSCPQWAGLEVIVTADRFLPPPLKITNITDGSAGVWLRPAALGPLPSCFSRRAGPRLLRPLEQDGRLFL